MLHIWGQGREVGSYAGRGGCITWLPHTLPLVCCCLQEGALQGLECYPVPIMRWTESFYMDVFRKHGEFKLQEHGAHAAAAPSMLMRRHPAVLRPGQARNTSRSFCAQTRQQ